MTDRHDIHGRGRGDVSRATHLFLLLVTAAFASFFVWAAYGRLDIVSLTQGEVVPSTRVKRVQHLEGGIVGEILVQEGDTVEPGQSLVILEKTIQGSSVEELGVHIASLTVDAARLAAEAEGREPVFSEDIRRSQPGLIRQAEELFQVRASRLASEKAAKRAEVAQVEQDVLKIRARLRNTRKSLQLLEKELAISTELLRDQLTTELQHIRLQREVTQVRSGIEEDEAALRRAGSVLNEKLQDLSHIGHSFREKARDQLSRVRRDLDETTQRLRKFSDSLQRTVIRAPEAGVVKKVDVTGPGEVVQAGQTVLELVPLSDRLVIEAHLPIADIGYVQKGQRAVVRLATRDARRFGSLEGRVAHISPDTFATAEGQAFYAVRIETDQAFFERDGNRYNLFPGMIVEASIHTGTRTVLEYLAEPFLGSMSTALRER